MKTPRNCGAVDARDRGVSRALLRGGMLTSMAVSVLVSVLHVAMAQDASTTQLAPLVVDGDTRPVCPGGLINAITKRPQDRFGAEVYTTLGDGHVETGFDVGGPSAPA